PQAVRMGRYVSASLNLSTGAPQGCILSTLLYSLYTYDCVATTNSTTIIRFADDTVVVGLISDNNEMAYLEKITNLENWCQRNNLLLNWSGEWTASDTSVFTSRWTCHGPHINTVVKKAWQRLYHLRGLRDFRLPSKVLRKFYSCTIDEVPEAEDSEVDSFITQAEVTEVVQQLLGGKAPGVDEIRPEYLKSLDVVGLSWLTRLCNIAWQSGTVPLDWVTGVVVPLFKKGDRRVCSNYRRITLLSLPGKVYSRVLKRRVRLLVEPRIQEEQCGFRPGCGTLDQLYTLHRVLEGLWEFAQPVHMCFADLEKAFDRVPRGILWEVLWEYGVRGPLLRAVRSLYKELGSHCLL
ncbi:hypothetical protein QTP70_023831, partial [Hemibagrus guttatus]